MTLNIKKLFQSNIFLSIYHNQVTPLSGNIVVSSTSACDSSTYTVTLPSDDTSTGIASSDIHIYVTATNLNEPALAFGVSCQLDDSDNSNNRPIVGRLNINIGKLIKFLKFEKISLFTIFSIYQQILVFRQASSRCSRPFFMK